MPKEPTKVLARAIKAVQATRTLRELFAVYEVQRFKVLDNGAPGENIILWRVYDKHIGHC